MTHLSWLSKVQDSIRILGTVFLLTCLGIGSVTAQGVFLLPDWIWFIFDVVIRILALYLCACSLQTFLFSRIALVSSSVWQPTVSAVCQIAGCFGLFAFVCSFIPSPFFSIVSFVCISVGFFPSILTDHLLKQRGEQTIVQGQYPSHPRTEPPLSTALRIIICHDMADGVLAKQLSSHLHPLIRRGIIELWDQTNILPGAITRDEVQYALESASVALVLISPNLLSSDYIMEYQLPVLLRSAESQGTLVIPIKARSCYYDGTGLEVFQPLSSKNQKTLAEMSVAERDELFSQLTKQILQHLGMTSGS